MNHRAGLVPVYCFGENQLFDHEPRWVLRTWAAVNRVVKVGAPAPIRGAFGLPVPYRRELTVVTGAPLFAEEGESLDAFHARSAPRASAPGAGHALTRGWGGQVCQSCGAVV